MKKLLLLLAGGVGYVLGTRAGRERYDQLKTATDKVRNDPRVQQRAQQATDFAKNRAPGVTDRVTSTASAAKGRFSKSSSSTGSTTSSTDTTATGTSSETAPIGDSLGSAGTTTDPLAGPSSTGSSYPDSGQS